MSPEDAAAHAYTPHQRAIIDKQSALWIVGAPETVKAAITAKAEEAGADEVMVTTTVWSHELRLRSYGLLARAFDLHPPDIGAAPGSGDKSVR
jgi:alkanesulfonate monooxygenase SsuD/methylene tetrahydromethanopterin reductase-like flavin-dependent oxidoreductase (luciferase family)